MRKLLNLINPLFEAIDPATAELKELLAKQIKTLPDDAQTTKALREIEDLLQHIGSGGRMGIINNALANIGDPSVTAAQKDIARYIMSLDMTPAQRTELFTNWKADKLINTTKLLAIGKKTFADIVNGYNTNPVIKELTNELMRISALGQGKGEFGLSALSKSITKPTKGDLLINGRKIEVKTTDGGAGRFTDQEVRPAEGFEAAARALNAFIKAQGGKIPASGLGLTDAARYAGILVGSGLEKELAEFLKLTETVIRIIFGGAQAKVTDIKAIMREITDGDPRAALQEYAKASFNYYMSKKDDEGVLYIDLTTDPIEFIYFKTADDLSAHGLRLHAGTVYITSIADVRLPYPQMEITNTTGGMDQADRVQTYQDKLELKAEKEAAKAAKAANVAGVVGGRNSIRPPGAATSPAQSAPRQRRSPEGM